MYVFELFGYETKKQLTTLMSGPQSKMCVFKANSNAIFIVEKIKFPFYCQTLEIVLDEVLLNPFLMTKIETLTKRWMFLLLGK